MKFKIYDKVWIILGNKIREYTVYERGEEKMDGCFRIGFSENRESWLTVAEEDLFLTKQDLLDSL